MPGGNLVRSERFRKAPRTPRSAHARYYYTRSLVLDSPVKKRSVTPRIRCQSAPRVMDSHSRSASPREPTRPQHKPPSPPSSPTGFDNRAYQHDEASDPNHNDSFASNGPQQNGHSKEPNGNSDTKTLEAVNLELINLTPKNGSAKKKDVDVEMNTSNPYDEYFVPVNEHRKYMRGEKLYVTADKRGEKGSCKRPLCWTLLGLVVAAIVAIIVLAATGILFTNSPTTLEQYNSSITSARALGGIGSHLHQGHSEHDHEFDQHTTYSDQSKEPVHKHGPQTQNDEGRDHSLESGESNQMYVARTVEGEVKIDNEEFIPALQDVDSNEYRDFVTTFASAMKRALFSKDNDNDVSVEVIQLREGSIIVTYRVHWKSKASSQPSATTTSDDILTPRALKDNLNNYLNRNNRMINIYHIAEDKMVTKPVLDLCQMNKNGCEFGCKFDEVSLDFVCTCPPGHIINMANPKKCMSLFGSTENGRDGQDSSEKVSTTAPDSSASFDTKATTTTENKPAVESEHSAEQPVAWDEPHHVMPETTTDSETEVSFSNIIGQSSERPNESSGSQRQLKSDDTTSDGGAGPQPTAEPTAAPEPAAEPSAEPSGNSTSDPETSSESDDSDTKSEPESKTSSGLRSDLESELKSEPEVTAEPEPQSEPEPEPSSEQETEQDKRSEIELEPKPEPEPEPTSLPEPSSKSEQTIESQYSLGTGSRSETELESQSEIERETTSETESEPVSDESEVTATPAASHYTIIPTMASSDSSEKNPTTDTTSELQTTPKSKSIEETINSLINNIQAAEHESESDIEATTNTVESQSPTTVDPKSEEESNEDKTVLYTNEGKFETKSSNNMDETPVKISPNSNEMKPDVMSILSYDGKAPLEYTTEANDITTTTDSSDWLEAQVDSKLKTSSGGETNDNIGNAYANILNNNNEDKIIQQSEPRSFKSFDEDDFLFDTTTSVITTDINGKGKETSTHVTEMNETSTMPESEETVDDVTTSVNMKVTTAKTITETSEATNSLLGVNSNGPNKLNEEKSQEVKRSEKDTLITSIIQEANSLPTNETMTVETTTPEVEAVSEFSLNKHYQNTDEEKLMAVLEQKPSIAPNETSTEYEPDEGMDITFDSINMLYNRSSKSIDNLAKNTTDSNGTSEIPRLNDGIITTDSDWLSEPVTQMNYNDVMNKMGTPDSTESALNKVEDVIRNGLVKDDFEPDYLNNMGTNNKQDDEPLYSMVHDYDTEENRYKRVNKEVFNENSVSNTSTAPLSPAPTTSMETTTVGEYIYKSSTMQSKDSDESMIMVNKTDTNDSSSSSQIGTAAPAPVWEESETESSVEVKDEPMETKNVMIDEIQMPTTDTGFVPQKSPDASNEVTTQSSNLNVTIYEISSHNNNKSSGLRSTNAHSAEFVDHDTEMNPFLPEVENNKSLVKKLQEGHDLEPANLNETQNENTEEHIITSTEGEASTKEISNASETVTDDNMSNLSLENSSNVNTEDQKVPISTFLLDTDDLVTTKEPTTMNNIRIDSQPMTSTSTPSSTNENLSVVPIGEENDELNGENDEKNEDLNDITESDLPKSDKRTLDAVTEA